MRQAVTLPGPLRLEPAFGFAGRARELATLRALLPRSSAEGRRAALVAGEPGSGKSRLVRELAHLSASEGAIVVYGDCDGVVRTPYGPFVAVLEQLVHHAGRGELHERLGAGVGVLARVLPGLADEVGVPQESAEAADADAERHRLHTAVTDLLAEVGSRAPILLVLEDIHWADPSSVLLVRHLVRAGASVRMLLVATFRDVEADMPAVLSSALVDIHRTEGVVRLRLAGLSQDEVADFVRLAAGAEPSHELTAMLAGLTAGNAFLLTELWRELIDSGGVEAGTLGVRLTQPAAQLHSPNTVREVVGQRLLRLEAETKELLALGAVAGAEFDLDTVRRASAVSEAVLLDSLDEAVRNGLVVEESGSRGLAFRFTHELVRRAITDRLSVARKGELHLRVAEALEHGRPGGSDRGRLSALAHHYSSAAPVGGVERAVEYNLRAADSALEALAFGEAAERFRAALAFGLPDDRERAAVTLRLGEACHRAGDAGGALDAFSRTAELARSLGDAELLARAAIGFEDACWRPAIHDGRSVELLEEAEAALPDNDSDLRALVLGGLARALDLRGDRLRAGLARDESIAMSRRRGDRRSLAATLAASYWARGRSTNEEVNRMLLEARALAEELGDVEIGSDALAWLVPSYVVMGDHDAARDALAELQAVARRVSQPFLSHVAEHYAAALALCDGDLVEAEQAAARSSEWGKLLTGRDPSGTYGIQMFGLRREQGRLAELAPLVRLLDADTMDSAWRPGLVVLLAELAMEDEARRALRGILDAELGSLRPSLWLATLAYLTDAAVLLGDTDAAEALYPELLPYAGGNTMVGHLVACYGAADRYLGTAAALLGDWERAESHFQSALALNTRLGARTWLAHTAYAYGRMLLARNVGEDRAHARAQLGLALGLARAIGLPVLIDRVTALGAGVEPAAPLPEGLSAREVEILVEVARGRSNREIGRALHISEHTAANHLRSILRKTGCANRTEAAGWALRRGLVPD